MFGAGDRTPEEPEIPDSVLHVWDWFWDLHARRLPGFESKAPITWDQIGWWSQLTRTVITPEEVRLLVRMDDEFLATVAEEQKAKRERDEQEREMNKQRTGRR